MLPSKYHGLLWFTAGRRRGVLRGRGDVRHDLLRLPSGPLLRCVPYHTALLYRSPSCNALGPAIGVACLCPGKRCCRQAALTRRPIHLPYGHRSLADCPPQLRPVVAVRHAVTEKPASKISTAEIDKKYAVRCSPRPPCCSSTCTRPSAWLQTLCFTF